MSRYGRAQDALSDLRDYDGGYTEGTVQGEVGKLLPDMDWQTWSKVSDLVLDAVAPILQERMPPIDDPGELLLDLTSAIGIPNADFLAMPPADVVEVAKLIALQADTVPALDVELTSTRYRADLALAVLDSMTTTLLPVMQGLATAEQTAEANLVFSRVHQALQMSRGGGDDPMDPDAATERLAVVQATLAG